MTDRRKASEDMTAGWAALEVIIDSWKATGGITDRRKALAVILKRGTSLNSHDLSTTKYVIEQLNDFLVGRIVEYGELMLVCSGLLGYTESLCEPNDSPRECLRQCGDAIKTTALVWASAVILYAIKDLQPYC